MSLIRKIITKQRILEILASGGVSFPPLRLRVRETIPSDSGVRVDATVEAEWENNTQVFAVECRVQTSPRELEDAAGRAKLAAVPPDQYPMILVPYLSPDNLERLDAIGVSGLDLCGNGFIGIPGRLLIMKSGSPNRFPTRQPIANPYRGSASLVARTLLLCSRFPTAKTVLQVARQHGAASLSPGTVSKALRALEEDLIVSRTGREVALSDPETLLRKLEARYRPPRLTRRLKGKCPRDRIRAVLSAGANTNIRLVPTGRWSAQAYAAGERSGPVSIYCSNLNRFLALVGANAFQEDEFFPDVELLETDDDTAYFDARTRAGDGNTWASPIQSYLELMSGGEKRDREIAEQVRRAIVPRIWHDNQ